MAIVQVSLVLSEAGTPLNEVTCYFYRNSTFVSSTVSDVMGEVTLPLEDSTTYNIRFFKPGVSFRQPTYISVLPLPGINTFDISGQRYVYPFTHDVNMCRCSGYFKTSSGSPAAGILVVVEPTAETVRVGSSVAVGRGFARTDVTGYLELDLYRSVTYVATISGIDEVGRLMTVPDAPQANLIDYLFPYIKIVTGLPTSPLELTAPLSLTPVVTKSNGDVCDNLRDVTWESSDTDVFTVTISASELILSPVSPGTALLRVTRVCTEPLLIPNTPIEGQPLTVNIGT